MFPGASPSSPAKYLAGLLIVLAGTWVTLVNGLPFLMADSSAYVREPDFAVVHLFGTSYSTAWTQPRTLVGHSGAAEDKKPTPRKPVDLNSPYEHTVLVGRSSYYGVLLYLAHLLSDLWLAVFVQSAIFVWLTYVLIVRCLSLSTPSWLITDMIILLITPCAFFLGFMIPDVFAGFLLIGVVLIAGFWHRLSTGERTLTIAFTGYAALCHTSHLLLLALLTACVLGTWTCSAIGIGSYRKFWTRSVVLLGLVAAGVAGELSFTYAVQAGIGADPVRPPFVMARLIADGPGYRFLQAKCAQEYFVVCSLMERLPTHAQTFLWSMDPQKGVFSVSPPELREALSLEQTRFALRVFLWDPAGVLKSSLKDISQEIFAIGVDEFFPTTDQLESFRDKLPTSYFQKLMRSRISLNRDLLPVLDRVFFSVYFGCLIPTLGLFLAQIGSFGSNAKFYSRSNHLLYPTQLIVVGLLLNAAICGALSEPYLRYQSRISWLPVLIVAVFAATIIERMQRNQMISHRELASV